MRGAQVADAWVTQMRADRDKSRLPDRSRKAFAEAVKRALAAGFSETQAPFAASASLTMAWQNRGEQPARGAVRDRCRERWPALFGARS